MTTGIALIVGILGIWAGMFGIVYWLVRQYEKER